MLLLSDNACTATPGRRALVELRERIEAIVLQRPVLLLSFSACTATPGRRTLIVHGERY